MNGSLRTRRRVAVLGGLIVLAGAPTDVLGQDKPLVWISTSSAILGQASDLAIAPDRTMYVLDRLNAYVIVLDGPGDLRRTIGREGSGPGEFIDPIALELLAEGGFDVVDRGNNRIQRFDSEGAYVSSRDLPPYGASYPVALSADGSLAVNTLSDTSLVAVYDSEGRLLSRFGHPPSAMPGTISMGGARQDILDGKIPGFFRNTVQPRFAPDGSIWLGLLTDGGVQRWVGGDQQASYRLDEPEMAAVRERFFERARDPALRGLPSLSFIADLFPTPDGVWVLMRGGEDAGAVIIRVSNEGQRTGRWTFPGVTNAGLLAVDPARQSAFLTLSSTAEVVEVRVSETGRLESSHNAALPLGPRKALSR